MDDQDDHPPPPPAAVPAAGVAAPAAVPAVPGAAGAAGAAAARDNIPGGAARDNIPGGAAGAAGAPVVPAPDNIGAAAVVPADPGDLSLSAEWSPARIAIVEAYLQTRNSALFKINTLEADTVTLDELQSEFALAGGKLERPERGAGNELEGILGDLRKDNGPFPPRSLKSGKWEWDLKKMREKGEDDRMHQIRCYIHFRVVMKKDFKIPKKSGGGAAGKAAGAAAGGAAVPKKAVRLPLPWNFPLPWNDVVVFLFRGIFL